MKKLLLCLSFIFLLASCHAKIEVVELSINPEYESYTFIAEGESINVSVITNQKDWSVSSSNTAWCTVSQSGNSAVITAAKNSDEKAREDAVITFSAGSGEWAVSVTMTVNQEEGVYTPVFEGADYDLPSYTKILSDDAISSISSYNSFSNTMTYPAGYSETNFPKVGEKIILSTVSEMFPEGFMGKVADVKTGSTGSEVNFEKISIVEAFKSLSIDTTALDLGSHVLSVIGPDGEAVSFLKTKGISQTSISFTMPSVTINTSENFSFTPKISVEIGMKFQLIIYDGEILSMNIIVDPETTVGVDFVAGIESQIWKYESNPYTIICGGFPSKYKTSYGIRYQQGEWDTVDRGSKVGTDEEAEPFSLSGSLNLDGKVYCGAKFGAGMGVYGDVLSFDLAISPKIQATANLNFNLDAFTASQSLYRTLRLSALETALSASGFRESLAQEFIKDNSR